MSEKLIHEPVLTKDENTGVVYLKCVFCEKLLWYPASKDVNSTPHLHEPVLTKNETTGVIYLKCAFCERLLWYPASEDLCSAPHELPALNIDVKEDIGTEDIFG